MRAGASSPNRLRLDKLSSTVAASASRVTGRRQSLSSRGGGGGEWMRPGAADGEDAGGSLVCEPVIACGAPEGDAADACRELGKALAAV